ncbi:glutathione S-transferase family protein [Advenella alkanexedens]|uniref:Glutathione S-transferase family protein n=1 Tax=Advenella alkanexedens TaxID=1481665 RepID=A0ABS6NKK3_9BURK|nr:glutathione S-transferase family protein [Advenella alkanexedens]MBV4396159.1 glutathione S-transferase family protein [Advenella alkanexedens]
MLNLYDCELSENCYKVRLFLSILGQEHQLIPVELFPGQEHQQARFRAINPLAKVPVLDDNGFIVRDSQAILVYLACKYAPKGKWYPLEDASRIASVQIWLSFANDLNETVSAARWVQVFGKGGNMAPQCRKARQLLTVIDEHLWFAEKNGHAWLCPGEHPTIADLACFPHIMLSDEAGISLLDYPALRRWTDRVKGINGFTAMPGIFSVENN